MKRRFEQARGDESGAALVIALVFLAFIGLMAPALLNYSQTSLRATVGLREARGNVSGADSVIEGAINKIRGTRSAYTATDCFRATMNTVALRVDCSQTASFTDNLHVTFTTCLQSATAPCPVADIRGVAEVVYSDATSTAGVKIASWSVRK